MRKGTLVALALAAGFVGGTAVSLTKFVPAQAAGVSSDTYRQLDLFGDIFERVRADYVEEPEDSKLIESAINGMLTALDPHSSYMNPKTFRDMQVQTRGEFGGLGIEVTMEDGLVKVVAPIEDTPAARAGILGGDLITHLDKEPVQGLTLAQAVEKMRGAVNTPITLTIRRKGVDEPLEIKIVRDIIRIRAVRFNKEGDDIGYVRITAFNEQTFDGLKRAISELGQELGKDKLKGFIVDLRNNPGGLLDQAIAVSDAFLDHGEIVSTRGRNVEETQRYNARKGDLTDGSNIVVLINGGSASASEIVAGALQDHRRATIVGTRSFGKASVQTIFPLGANGAIRLTTARYYTPEGRSIQARGIDPDIIIEQELPEELKKAAAAAPRGEASLPGHLRGDSEVEDEGEGKSEGESETQKEDSGSSTYIPPEKADDKQLNYAFDLIRGIKINRAYPPDPKAPVAN